VSGDFDRDGSTDLAVLYAGAGSEARLRVFGAGGTGDLIAILDGAIGFAGPGPSCAADLTGEGMLDVLVATADPAAPLALLPGQGDITFGQAVPASTSVPFDAGAALACADLDGDRRDDLALLRPGRASGLSVLRSTGTALAAPLALPVEGSAVWRNRGR